MNLDQITESVNFLKKKGIVTPEIGIVLGTGLGNLVTEIEVEIEIPYEQIPNFPLSTVESHSGKLLYGVLGGKQVLAMQGRFHAYEGYSMEEIVFPVRTQLYGSICYQNVDFQTHPPFVFSLSK